MPRNFYPLVALLLAASHSARAQETPNAPPFRGPLPLQDERPFQAIFLHFRAEAPEILAPGHQKWGAGLFVANNLLIPAVGPNGERVEEDFETQTLLVSYRRGISRGLEMGADLPITARDGGFLDTPIRIYHHLLGFTGDGPDNPVGRDNRSRGRSVLSFQDANGAGVNEGNAFGLGDAVFTLKKPLTRGRFASAVRGAVKIPTGSAGQILGSGGTDFGLNLDARYAFNEHLALGGHVSALRFGGADVVPDARKNGVGSGLSLEYRGHKMSFIAQADGATPNVLTGNRFADRVPFAASLGIKKPMGPNKTFWAGFSENGDYQGYTTPILGGIGPDFAVHVGMEWRR